MGEMADDLIDMIFSAWDDHAADYYSCRQRSPRCRSCGEAFRWAHDEFSNPVMVNPNGTEHNCRVAKASEFPLL